MKVCSKCRTEKSADQFHKNKAKKDGLQPYCKPCHRAMIDAWQSRNVERVRLTTKGWTSRHADFVKKHCERRRLKKYGITSEQYRDLLAQCGGKCMICRRQPDKTIDIDHCHKTGRVRGLLCNGCNTGLAKFRDDATVLEAAIEYLRT